MGFNISSDQFKTRTTLDDGFRINRNQTEIRIFKLFLTYI